MSTNTGPRVSMEFTYDYEELLRLLQISNYTQVDNIDTYRDASGAVQRLVIAVSREHKGTGWG